MKRWEDRVRVRNEHLHRTAHTLRHLGPHLVHSGLAGLFHSGCFKRFSWGFFVNRVSNVRPDHEDGEPPAAEAAGRHLGGGVRWSGEGGQVGWSGGQVNRWSGEQWS